MLQCLFYINLFLAAISNSVIESQLKISIKTLNWPKLTQILSLTKNMTKIVMSGQFRTLVMFSFNIMVRFVLYSSPCGYKPCLFYDLFWFWGLNAAQNSIVTISLLWFISIFHSTLKDMIASVAGSEGGTHCESKRESEIERGTWIDGISRERSEKDFKAWCWLWRGIL